MRLTNLFMAALIGGLVILLGAPPVGHALPPETTPAPATVKKADARKVRLIPEKPRPRKWRSATSTWDAATDATILAIIDEIGAERTKAGPWRLLPGAETIDPRGKLNRRRPTPKAETTPANDPALDEGRGAELALPVPMEYLPEEQSTPTRAEDKTAQAATRATPKATPKAEPDEPLIDIDSDPLFGDKGQ